jgi:hypothetical protein
VIVPCLAAGDAQNPGDAIMRLRGASTRRAASLIVPIAALSLALGGGAASAGTLASQNAGHRLAGPATAASGVTWHKIFAINGWQSAQGTDGTGAPSWGVKGGVVYLSGSVLRRGGSSRLCAELPPQARPSHAMWITVYTLDESLGEIVIYPNGKVYAYGADATGFTSLAGVSYPARSTPQKKLTLINGWKSSQSAWNSGDPSYTVKGGVVYLSGSLHQPSGTSDHFALLPKAARPARAEYINVYTDLGTYGTVWIGQNGIAEAYSGSATGFTSLAGISYPAATASQHNLTLLNGWHPEQKAFNTGDPAYRVSGGVVYLSGSLATPGTIAEFAVLPPGARPAHILYIKVYADGSSVGTLRIYPNGDMSAYNLSASVNQFTSLATISFPLKS